MALGEKFIGGGLARAYKEAYDKLEDERLSKLTTEERQAELDEFAKSPWVKKLFEAWAEEVQSDLDELTYMNWLNIKPMSSDDPGYRDALDKHVKAVTDGEWKLAVCECGVGITGGLHSDYCPLYEKPSV
jgi:hypothetical protein